MMAENISFRPRSEHMKPVKKISLLCLCTLLLTGLLLPVKAEAADYKFNMSYIYFGGSSEYTGLVDKTQNSLNEVSPNYFALKSDGSLVLTAALNASFINDMHQRGIAVVPYLSNDWSRTVGKAALRNREQLSLSLAEAVTDNDLDGVNIDIENVTSSEKAAYVDFIRLLRLLLPDKRIVVSVAANPWGISTGWQGSYDYAGLAEYCDYLMMMTYDEHYCGGPAGPISSLSYIEDSIEYALSVIPKEQLVLGLPFYGRIWSDTGGHPNGYGVSNAAITQYISRYGGTVRFDPTSKSAKAVITIKPEDKKPVIGGKALEAGTYTIWYENEQSIKTKLELIAKFDIKGTGSWCLGQETSNTWDYYKLWLNNCTFTDIETSWAKDYILDAYMNSYITGFSSESFAPDAPLTRAQAVAVLVRKLGLSPVLEPSYAFDDCVGNWAQPYIETARKYGMVGGVGGNLFAPDRPIARTEMTVLLRNAIALQTYGGDTPFTDLAPVVFLLPAAGDAAVIDDVLSEYSDSETPAEAVTRAEMTVLLAKIPDTDALPGAMAKYVPV
jgi:spore germination protein YaaH